MDGMYHTVEYPGYWYPKCIKNDRYWEALEKV